MTECRHLLIPSTTFFLSAFLIFFFQCKIGNINLENMRKTGMYLRNILGQIEQENVQCLKIVAGTLPFKVFSIQ